MPWIQLALAGLLEAVWATSMKQSHGFTRPIPAAVTVVAMAASLWLLALAMRSIPLGTAYMLWTGIGAVSAFIVGIVLLGEPVNLLRLVAAALVLAGLLLMKFATA